ncbi:hypothetical protein [Pseudoalteromonas byunsanensis]|uniref:Uncharacterized protein n=1 Tax=Pseudoalteromonas byunsanensis TaxID=327939 RepID=A0A1S1N869_9GAMM|nr:hypothetical protein [Pseudoalteromonas byunsanensis]OHU97560.1 hypothetical protein BIW53_02000 [Pseudoalteromonas byunsanensis]
MSKIENIASDMIDMLSNPASRAGSTLHRINKMSSKGVSSKTIAVQLEENSKSGTSYTAEQVEGFNKLYDDCKTKVGVTKEQTKALINDQKSQTGKSIPAT